MAATLAAECSSRFTDSEHYNKYKVLHWVCYQSKHTVVVCEEVCVRVAVGGGPQVWLSEVCDLHGIGRVPVDRGSANTAVHHGHHGHGEGQEQRQVVQHPGYPPHATHAETFPASPHHEQILFWKTILRRYSRCALVTARCRVMPNVYDVQSWRSRRPLTVCYLRSLGYR